LVYEFPEDGADLPIHLPVVKDHTFIKLSVTCIATRYGLEGPGIETRWRRDFPHPPRSVLGLTPPPIHGYRLFPGCKAAGAWRWPRPPSSAEVKERV